MCSSPARLVLAMIPVAYHASSSSLHMAMKWRPAPSMGRRALYTGTAVLAGASWLAPLFVFGGSVIVSLSPMGAKLDAADYKGGAITSILGLSVVAFSAWFSMTVIEFFSSTEEEIQRRELATYENIKDNLMCISIVGITLFVLVILLGVAINSYKIFVASPAFLRALPGRIFHFVSSVFRFLRRFTWQLFIRIHSQERLICGVDALLGAAVGYLAGSALVGALVGGVLGVINYELVTRRWLIPHGYVTLDAQ